MAALVIVTLVDDPVWVAAGLGLAYSLAYGVGVVVSFRRLRRTLPDLDPYALVRHCVRLLLAALPAAALAWVVCWAVTSRSGSRAALFLALVVAGVVAVATFVGICRLLKVREVTQITSVLRRRRAAEPLEGVDPPEDADDTAVRGAVTNLADASPRLTESSVTTGGSDPRAGPPLLPSTYHPTPPRLPIGVTRAQRPAGPRTNE